MTEAMDRDAPLTIPVDFDPFADAPDAGMLPLTEPQKETWAGVQMGDDASRVYSESCVLTLHGNLSVASMQRALQQVVDRHDALRVSIDPNAEGQSVAPALTIALPLIDLSDHAVRSRAAEIARILEREAVQPFDLTSAPLLRAKLIREAVDLHRLVLTAHHMVCDGWSWAVLLRDLSRGYARDREGLRPQLPPPASYFDYVTRAAAHGRESAARADEDYWAQQYADTVPVLDLPLDRRRPGHKTYNGARQEMRLDESLCREIKAAGARHGCTLFVVLLAAFEALLSRLTAQDDFVVGVPMAGQALLDNRHLVGHCVNMVPLRCRIGQAAGFVAHLQHVRQAFVEAQSHQQVAFGSLLRRLNVPCGPGHPPFLSVTFNIDRSDAPFNFGDLRLDAVERRPKRFVAFDFSMNGVDNGRDLLLECEYNTDLFTPSTIKRWLRHYRVVLEAIAAGHAEHVGRLPLLTAAERQQAISGWNLGLSYPKGSCLHERFERQAARTPQAVALVCEEQKVSYADLNSRANRLAHRLRKLGVGPDQLVGLRIERSIEMVVGIIGVLKAGGAYLPLDPAYPKERIAFMLEDSRVGVVVTEPTLAADLDGIGVSRVLLDGDLADADSDPGPVTTADNLAYAIYTSGSTGKPKGVLITHYNVTRLFDATAAWYHFDQHDVWTLFHSYAFDFSVWELWGALLYGGRVVIVPYSTSRSPEAFRDLLVRERVTVLNQTPSAFRQLIQADLSQPKTDFALRYVIFGGEALELQSLRPWFERYSETRPQLVNMYGITETTVHVTYRPIRQADVESAQGSVIGMPIPDLQIYILDPYGEPAPIGVPGEIYVGGAGVALGYLNRAELTAKRFIPDPFRAIPGARLYRTGDLARRFENGDIEYLGRLDNQVKIRGFRIEAGEIEAAILQHPAVRQVAVVAREDVHGEKQLVAYLVAENQTADIAGQLRSRLRTTMPEYMVPAHFVPLQSLPLTPNGKLNRKALPRPSRSRPNLVQAYVEPRTPLERYIANLWCQILDIDQVGAEDRFFEVGGDSLRAARFINQLRNRLNESIFITTLFDAPTVAQYAAMLERDYAGAVGRTFGGPVTAEAARSQTAGIDEAAIAQLRRCVPSRAVLEPAAGHQRNPPALFILAPPRSGTTLLRVMLAGHPGLFAAPELQLLGFETLEERRQAYCGRHALWREGGIRALMEVRACAAEDAKCIMAELEQRGLSTRAFYRYLQAAVGGRMLVDKSPAYALDPNALARAERDFDEPLYIHLVRHPYAMVTSFEREHMDQVLHLEAHDFSTRQLGELIWLVSHLNIRDFLANIPQRRQYVICYEEMVTRPRSVMQEMCARLGIPFDEGVLRPYDNLDRKMTDGLQPDSTPMGDTHLFQYQSISPHAAARWRGVVEDNFLSEPTWQLAELLGYERPGAPMRAVTGRMGA